jgi:2',3'-cyclic-nucleotide 2'-phosphodiesterase (5'-nucleotidase family)
MTRLTILHTNDLHGCVEQVLRIAALARKIKHEVTTNGGHCMLWDAGDAEDTILYESSITKGRAMMAILRGAGYELEALGNASPSRYGPQAVAGLADAFGRPLLCANMIDPATGQLVKGLEPYTLQTCGDITLGIIGLTAVMRNYATFFKLHLREPAVILPDLITEVRDHGAQTIVLLSHLGSKQDIALAEQIEGLDVIIGAHDHVELSPPLVVNRTIIAQAGDFGRFLGRLDLELDSYTGKVVHHQGRLIPIIEELPIDPSARQALEDQRAAVRQFTRASSERPHTRSIWRTIVNAPPGICWPMHCASACRESRTGPVRAMAKRTAQRRRDNRRAVRRLPVNGQPRCAS